MSIVKPFTVYKCLNGVEFVSATTASTGLVDRGGCADEKENDQPTKYGPGMALDGGGVVPQWGT